MVQPCVTCSGSPGRLSICRRCAERAEAILHAPVPWTKFEKAELIHPDILAEGFDECWKNSRYTVLVRHVDDPQGDLVHLSIKRNDRNPLHDWRDLQRIKNEILGPDEEAMELYPAERRLIDTANQYHLWCYRGLPAPFGYKAERCVMEDTSDSGAKQRPFEDKPSDLLTEEEFQAKYNKHKAMKIAAAGYAEQIRSLLETAHVRPCQRPEWNVDAKKCEDVWPGEPGYWCGPCMAKILKKLSEESASL